MLDLGLSLTRVSTPPNSGGNGGPYRAKAQAILAAIATGGEVPTSTDIPVYSETTGWTPSLLNGASGRTATLKPMDSAMTRFGTVFEAHASVGAPYTLSRAQNVGYQCGFANGCGYRFRIESDAFDVFIANDGTAMKIKVNGAFLPAIYRTTGAYGYRTFTFPTKAARDIELHLDGGAVVAGVNVRSGDPISALPFPMRPKSMIFGDSYVESMFTYYDEGHVDAGDLGHKDVFPVRLREQMGLPAMFIQGRGGQGAVKVANGQSFLSRVQSGDLTQAGSDMDLVIVHNSVNDRLELPGDIQANWQAILTRLKADQPNAVILGFSGFKTTSFLVDSAHNAAFINAFNAVRDDSRMAVWDGDDVLVTPSELTSFAAPDDIHLNPIGALTTAQRVTAQFATLLAGF